MSSSQPEQFPLLPCTIADVPQMAAVYTSAFVPDETDGITLVAMPPTVDPAAKQKWLLERLTVAFGKPSVQHWKIVDTSTAKIVAWCRWELPNSGNQNRDIEKKEEEVRPDLPEGANVAYWTQMFKGLEMMRAKYVEGQGDMHRCDFLMVHADYQGKGLGAKLMKYGTRIADLKGERVYIESTKKGWGLYRKFGFRNVDVLEYDMRDYGGETRESHIIMVRVAAGGI